MAFVRAFPAGLADGQTVSADQFMILDEQLARAAELVDGVLQLPGIISYKPIPPDRLFPSVSANWLYTGIAHVCQVEISTPIYAYILVPKGTTILAVSTVIQGAAHGASWPPGGMPTLEADRLNMSDGSSAQIGTTTTAPDGNQSGYETRHVLSVNSITGDADAVFNDDYQMLRVKLTNESGTNAIAGLQVFGLLLSAELTAASAW